MVVQVRFVMLLCLAEDEKSTFIFIRFGYCPFARSQRWLTSL